jgi:phage gpG-like protein
MGISVTVENAGVLNSLAVLLGRMTDLTPAMRDIGTKLESRVLLRFDTKTDPAGQPWAPWSPLHAKLRAEQRRGTLLSFSGRMRASLTNVPGPTSVEVGFGVEYAKYHEQVSKGKGILPARRMLTADGRNLSQTDRAAVLRIVNRYLAQQPAEAQ